MSTVAMIVFGCGYIFIGFFVTLGLCHAWRRKDETFHDVVKDLGEEIPWIIFLWPVCIALFTLFKLAEGIYAARDVVNMPPSDGDREQTGSRIYIPPVEGIRISPEEALDRREAQLEAELAELRTARKRYKEC